MPATIVLNMIKILVFQKFEVFFGFVYLFAIRYRQSVHKSYMFECFSVTSISRELFGK